MKRELEQEIFDALADTNEAYGLQICDRINAARTKLGLPELGEYERSRVYATLREMADHGRLHTREGETAPGRNGYPRIYYRTPWRRHA